MADDKLVKSLITDSTQLIDLIKESKCRNENNCDQPDLDNPVIDDSSLITQYGQLKAPESSEELIYFIIRTLTTKPTLFDDAINTGIAQYYKDNKIKAKGWVTIENLNALYRTESPMTTWLKYETLLMCLIKELVYDPKTLANELLAIAKIDIDADIATKFSSVIKSCVKYCREASRHQPDDEEEEKWCEIIDWLSWAIVE